MPDVQYSGLACFRLRGRDGTVLCDPFDRSAGIDPGKPTAHIVTISNPHPHHSASQIVRPMREDELFVVQGPGDYEVRGVLITGVRTRPHPERPTAPQYNTVYVIHLDDVAFCHLGKLSGELTQPQLEEMGSVDVLLLPVGGGGTLNPDEAASVISQIEPSIVIPMYYALDGLAPEYHLAALEKFTHEVGLKDTLAVDKVTISPAMVSESEQTRFVLVQPSGGQIT